jgi:PilZ domain
MRLEGRIEKRVPMAVSVRLISLKESGAAERALTENVSSHGARIITQQRCQPGEQQRIASLSGEFHLSARVVYCQPLPPKGFCVGLEFRERSVNWSDRPFNSVV